MGSEHPGWIVDRLFLDSLLFLELLPAGPRRILDLGSGAGIPGIPIKIVRPELFLVLAEARRKRASFLRLVVRELGLTGVEVVEQRLRAEDWEAERRFDAVVARCAGEAGSVARIGLGLVREGGRVVLAGPPSPRPVQSGQLVKVRGRHFLLFSRAGPGSPTRPAGESPPQG